MPGPEQDSDFDDQDRAEVLDETNFDDDGLSIELRTFEELPDVYDATQAEGDADDDEAREAADFDEDAIGDDDLEEEEDLVELLSVDESDLTDESDDFDEDGLDEDDNIEGLEVVAEGAEEVSGGEDDFTNFQSKRVGDADLQRMGYADENGRAISENDD